MLTDDRLREIEMRYVSQSTYTLIPLLRAVEAEARREALQRANAELNAEVSRLYALRNELQADRDALRAENERLRGLLREAREAIRSMDESLDGEFSTGLLYTQFIARIDAALAGEKP